MKRLISAGLMFRNLVQVSSPALIEHVNRAMKHLCGKTSKLTDYHSKCRHDTSPKGGGT